VTTERPVRTTERPAPTTTTESESLAEWEERFKAGVNDVGWSYSPPVNSNRLKELLEKAILLEDYQELHKQYMDNPIAADKLYKGKIMLFEGKIDDIDREIAGNPYVTFSVDDFFQNIRVTFHKSEEDKITELSKGQTIVVLGECRGTLISSSVHFGDCLLLAYSSK
jgi:hypothetical protein